MRKIQWLTLVLLLFALSPTFATAETVAKMPKPTGYIDDYANVFSGDTKALMESLCVELHNKTKAQVFVVTIHSLDGVTIEQFANDLFHTWKIGEKKTDRGVLLLFAIKDHKYRYEVGYGLEEILNDAKVGDMGRAIVPDLRAGDYDGAAAFGLHQVAQVIADDSKVELDGLKEPADADQQAPPPPPEAAPSSESPTGKFILALLPFFFILAIIGIVAWAVVRAVRNGTASWGSGSSSSSDSSSSGSDSSSSSGDSFSGGDGGDSGGGGASGSW